MSSRVVAGTLPGEAKNLWGGDLTSLFHAGPREADLCDWRMRAIPVAYARFAQTPGLSCNSRCKECVIIWLAEAIFRRSKDYVRMFAYVSSDGPPTLRTYVLPCPPSSAQRQGPHRRFSDARGWRRGPSGSRLGGAPIPADAASVGPGGLKRRVQRGSSTTTGISRVAIDL
jgi:hypothetical protein